MAPRRLASSITLSDGTNTNSASLSTNFLISHGQAKRSTLTYSRVIHFIGLSFVGNGRSIGIEIHRRTVRAGQKRVKFAALAIEREGVGAGFGRHDVLGGQRPHADDVDHAGIADGDVE